jgi:hypothetical protein
MCSNRRKKNHQEKKCFFYSKAFQLINSLKLMEKNSKINSHRLGKSNEKKSFAYFVFHF